MTSRYFRRYTQYDNSPRQTSHERSSEINLFERDCPKYRLLSSSSDVFENTSHDTDIWSCWYCEGHQYNVDPPYFVYLGLLFQPLSLDVLQSHFAGNLLAAPQVHFPFFIWNDNFSIVNSWWLNIGIVVSVSNRRDGILHWNHRPHSNLSRWD